MGKVETALKEEIIRVARREARKLQARAAEGARRLKSNVAALQTQVAALKRELADQQSKMRVARATERVVPQELKKSRLSPVLIKKLRKRINVTQAELAQLVGVSAGAVGFWETGKSQPRAALKARLVALRRVRRRDIRRLLAEKQAPAAKKPRKKAARKAKATKREAAKN